MSIVIDIPRWYPEVSIVIDIPRWYAEVSIVIDIPRIILQYMLVVALPSWGFPWQIGDKCHNQNKYSCFVMWICKIAIWMYLLCCHWNICCLIVFYVSFHAKLKCHLEYECGWLFASIIQNCTRRDKCYVERYIQHKIGIWMLSLKYLSLFHILPLVLYVSFCLKLACHLYYSKLH